MKKIIIFGLAGAVVACNVVASAAGTLGKPTVDITVNNNTSHVIKKNPVSCLATGNLPQSIYPRSSADGTIQSSFNGHFSCSIEYKSVDGSQKCSFTVSRFITVGNPAWGVDSYWNAPIVRVVQSSSPKCSGRVNYVTIDDNGDFGVELDVNF